jgi:hypothetical protein
VEWFKSQKTFKSNFLIICLVCAQIVLAEKLVKPEYSCGVPRTPNTAELKAMVRFQESFATPGQESLRLVPPFVPPRDGSQTHYHFIATTLCLFLLLIPYDLPPGGTYINSISILYFLASYSPGLRYHHLHTISSTAVVVTTYHLRHTSRSLIRCLPVAWFSTALHSTAMIVLSLIM